MKKRLIALVGGSHTRGEAPTPTRGGTMGRLPILLCLLAMSFLFAGCLVRPGRGHHGTVLIAPPLPPLVVLSVEPYYVQDGYHYHYQNDRWYYSQSRQGPWVDLPRDRYPRRVEYKRDERGRDQGRDQDHDRGRDQERGRDQRKEPPGQQKKSSGHWWRR
jgi:hypothetical protein